MYRKAAGIVVALLLCLAANAWAGDADYEKGVAFLRAGRVEEAIRLLEPLAAKGSKDPYLYYHLGLAYYKGDRLEQAFDTFKKTGELAGDALSKEFGLGAAFTNLGVRFFRKKQYDKASASLAEALSRDPQDGDGWYYSGLISMETGDYLTALKNLGQAARLKTGDDKAEASVHNAAGVVYNRQGDSARAMTEFTESLKLDPDNVEAVYYMGLLNYKENGYAAAKPYFDRLVSKGAYNEKTKGALFTTFFNMGVDFQNRDKAEDAVRMFQRASALRPDDADTHFYLGYNLAALERYDEAADEFRAALKSNPGMNKAKAQFEVVGKLASEKLLKDASSLMEKKEYYAAVPLYEKALSFDPAGAEAKNGLKEASLAVETDIKEKSSAIRSRLSGGEYTEAQKGVDELLKLYPGHAGVQSLKSEVGNKIASITSEYRSRADAALSRESLEEACGYLEKLLAVNPNDAKAAGTLSEARSRIAEERRGALAALTEGRLLAARGGFEKLVKYAPSDKEAKERLDEVRAKIAQAIEKSVTDGGGMLERGEFERAMESFRAALDLDPQNEAARRGMEKARIARAQAAQPPPAPTPAPAAPVSAGAEEQVRLLYLAGVESYTKGELKEAIAKWREALKLDPHNEKAISSIQKAEEKLKQASESPGKTP